MEVWDANLLYSAYLKAIKSSKWKSSTQKYRMHWMINLAKLQKSLKEGTYHISKTSKFIIHERGKTRVIKGNAIDDRIVHHVICHSFLTPSIKPYIIYSNGASQVGKGLGFQRNLLKKHLHKYYREHGTNKGYILIMDFSKFYDNIPHKQAFEQLLHHCHNNYVARLLWEALESMNVDISYLSNNDIYPGDKSDFKFDSLKYENTVSESQRTGKAYLHKSVSIGDQISQVIGIYYPTRFDTLAPCKYGIGESVRYQDDSYVMSDSLDELKTIFEGYKEICNKLGIYINFKKTCIKRIDKGFTFLKHQYRLKPSGSIVDKIGKKQVHAFRVRLKKIAKKVNSGERSFYDISNTIYSWMMAFHKYMSKRQINNMVLLICKLFHSQIPTWKESNNLIQLATPSKRKLIKSQYLVAS